MFDPIDPKQSFPALERGILKYWQEEDTFQRSVKNRTQLGITDPLDGHAAPREESFNFYDGPPFATGLPHYGHLLAGTIKDVIPRYQTMRGKRVERRFGWDCHGLPVENEIEKEHGLKTKKQIEEMGIAKFNALCRAAVQRYTKEWRVTVERMGRWVDMDWDYRTMDPDYMESIWWVFKQLADKKLIYEGHKPMHICPRCATPLSNFEVTQGYKDISDYSVTAMFKLRRESEETEESEEHMLAWTTTPWTLPGNLFLALGKKIVYVRVRCEGKVFILAEKRVEDVFKGKEHEVIGTVKATELIGRTYEPLFPYFAEKYTEKAFKVVWGDFVTTDEGTGIVHIAPGFGDDDFNVAKREKVPLLQHVSIDGHFTAAVTDFAGIHVKPKDDPTSGDKKIAEWLKAHGSLFKTESYTHSYPHCWRCDSPLLNYATSSWFVKVEAIKQDMLAVNAQTEWVPSHLRDGRFGKWLENARDWAISRNRYWGTPLPIWRCRATEELAVLESREDLRKRQPIRFTRVTVMRHGESDGNITPRYQGKLPGTNLTDRGKAQALRTAEQLKTEEVTRIYTSPLARTQQTAQAIAEETGAEVVVDERLREVEFGDYEGKSIDFGDLTFVKARRAHKLESGKVESIYHFPGMETWSQVQSRLSPFLTEVLEKHRGEHIVIVTHADPILGIRHFFSKDEPAKLCQQPYPRFASPFTFYWDQDRQAELDLHKETVDELTWPSSKHETSVEVTLVRHGETEWNLENKIQGGNADEPLNETGKAQSRELAKSFKKQKFDAVVSSDLLRASQSASILAEELSLQHDVIPELLRERNLGDWSGQEKEEFARAHPSHIENINPAFHYLTPPNGESLSQFFARVQKAYVLLLEKFAGKKILLVIHRGTIQALRTLAENLNYVEGLGARLENAGTATITLNPLMERIPEVLDCWFESGSMPYAQSHYPFESGQLSAGSGQRKGQNSLLTADRSPLPAGFPADFIAEGIDQTRGWFYTLTVLAAALFKKPAFYHCVVNGTVLAEDGRKMSKRLKNYPEPLEVVEKHGADAVRFALMSSPAVRAEDLRFSATVVEETVRSVLLPLWNTAAFFVTYANEAKFEPTETRTHSTHALDLWILAEVQDLVNRMTEQLDNYDLSATCAELHDTIDALTNWYVRLSRRRFAGKSSINDAEGTVGDAHEEDQHAALTTLHDVLLTISQLLAPFCPFITEALYLNLVPEDHGSVHLTDWPEVRKLTAQEMALLEKTRLLRSIVSLGMQIRAEQRIKARYPLAKAQIALPKTMRKNCILEPHELALLKDELNVKDLEFVDDASALAEAFVQVNARKVGPRLGAQVQEIIAAGKRGDYAEEADGSILILEQRLSPDEAEIVYRGKEGANVRADRGIVVSLDTTLTDALKREGEARDLIRAIQVLRKEAGLSVGDRITLTIEGAKEILADFGELIARETHATLGAAGGDTHEVPLESGTVTIRFAKA
ncbi:MAG: class I tRNA ligase family protein [Candidatus Peregrinibacteria bacterium]|nr:class I tRNA ligase family protein [Candidatus Peregrinibacteria bacterium]